jgi:hypothetical protein
LHQLLGTALSGWSPHAKPRRKRLKFGAHTCCWPCIAFSKALNPRVGTALKVLEKARSQN